MDLKNTGNAASVEIVNCIEKAGMEPSEKSLEQLGEAVAKIARQQAGVVGGVNLSFEESLWPGTYFGKQLYVRMFDFGAMPNATTKALPHNIDDVEWINVNEDFSRVISTEGIVHPVAYPHPTTGPTANWTWQITAEEIRMRAYVDRRALTAMLCIIYTKKSDPVIA